MGLLQPGAAGGYTIHPFLSNALQSYFLTIYNSPTLQLSAKTAFVSGMAELSAYCHNGYEDGNRELLNTAALFESNLLLARKLAIEEEWWGLGADAMQALRVLYSQTGRMAEWSRLVEETLPLYMDLSAEGPLQGRESIWTLVASYRVRIDRQHKRLKDAERLQRIILQYDRVKCARLFDLGPRQISLTARNEAHGVIAGLIELGIILRERSNPESIDCFREAFEKASRISAWPTAAVAAFNLGTTYKDISSVNNLSEAEAWYQKSLELRTAEDFAGKGRSRAQLSMVQMLKVAHAVDVGESVDTISGIVARGIQLGQEALSSHSPDALMDRAITHNTMGLMYSICSQHDVAMSHFREAIRLYHLIHDDDTGVTAFRLGEALFNTSGSLLAAGQLVDARSYALAAQRQFEQCGKAAIKDLENVNALLERIHSATNESISTRN
jgi:tetratricopeptide (TPR) repeat protein